MDYEPMKHWVRVALRRGFNRKTQMSKFCARLRETSIFAEDCPVSAAVDVAARANKMSARDGLAWLPAFLLLLINPENGIWGNITQTLYQNYQKIMPLMRSLYP